MVGLFAQFKLAALGAAAYVVIVMLRDNVIQNAPKLLINSLVLLDEEQLFDAFERLVIFFSDLLEYLGD
jgi:hypothetical protein